jgi:signal transduction protein with GAF and PtsI domain
MKTQQPNKKLLLQTLKDLKAKQSAIDAKWKKAADRQLLEFFVELIPLALNVERCSIFIVNSKQSNIWLQCGTGLKERSIKVPAAGSIVGEVVSTGKVLIEEDLENRMGAHSDVALKTGFHARDTLCVPIYGMATKTITGAIQVLNKKTIKREDIYTEHDISILKKTAFHIQMSIENLYIRQDFARVSEALGKQIKVLEHKILTLQH